MIRKLHVRNFKSLRDVEVELGTRNLFVGANMAGKSNVISVFRFLTRMVSPPPSTAGLASAIIELGGFQEVAWKGGDSSVITISLEGDGSGARGDGTGTSWKYDLRILGDPRGFATVEDESLVITRRSKSYQLIEKAQGTRLLKNPDGRLLSQFTESGRSALEFEIPDWEGTGFRNMISSWRFYRLNPSFMKSLNQTAAAAFLMEGGENFSSWLMTLQTGYSDAFEKIVRVMRDVFPSVESIYSLPTPQATVFVASKEKHLKKAVGAWQMSDGELSFLALLSLIFSPDELTVPLYCVEEPENYLHPRLMETLVEILKQTQDGVEASRRAQILITTHSPHLVDQFELGDLIVTERREGSTVLTRALSSKQLRELLKRKDLGLGELFYSGALGRAEP